MMHSNESISAAFIALLVSACAVGAQRTKRADVPLTDAALARYVQTAHNVARFRRQHPDQAIAPRKEYDSIEQAAAELCDRRPPVRQVVTSAGMTCSGFLAFTMKLEMTTAILRAGSSTPAGVRVPPADAAFVHAHGPEITTALREIGVEVEQ